MPSAMIGALRVQLGIDSAQFSNGLKRAAREASSGSRAIERSLSGIGRAVAGLTAGFAGMRAAQAFLAISDKAKSMESQLRLATASFGSFTKAQEDSERIAKEARGGIVETTSLYSSFLRTSAELGRTQTQAATATETFSKALKLGGASTAQINSATLQMGQALASANVQWEELGQILEASPRLGKVFTDYLGKTRGELKKMAEQGQLTNRMLFDALNDAGIAKGLNDDFKMLSSTFEEAVQQIENAAITTFGAFDRGGEFSSALSSFVTQGGDDFASLAKAAEQFGIEARSQIEGIVAVGTQAAVDIRQGYEALHDMFEPIRQAAESVFGIVRQEALSSTEYVASLFDTIDTIRNAPANAALGIRNMLKKNNGIDLPRNWFVPDDYVPSNYGQTFRNRAARSERDLRSKSRIRAATARLEKQGFIVPRNPDGTVNAAGVRRDDRRPTAPRAATGSAGKGGGKGKSAEQRQREAERAAEKAIRDQYQLDREALAGKREILSAQRDLMTDYTERNVASAQLVDLDRQQEQLSIGLQLKLKEIDATTAQQRNALEDQLATLRKRAIWQEEDLRRAEEAAQLDDLEYSIRQDELQAQSALAETAAERREIEMRLLDLARKNEQRLIDQIDTSTYGGQMQKEMRQTALDAAYERNRAGVLQQTQGPWEAFMRSLPDTAAKADEALQAVAANGMSDLTDGLADAMTGARSLGDTFKQVAKSIIADLIRIQIRKAVVGGLSNLLGGFMGGFRGGLSLPSGDTSFGLGNDLKPFTPNLTGLASGGSIDVLGSGGLDTNLLSINGMPTARINRGERIRVDPNTGPNMNRLHVEVDVNEGPMFRSTIRTEAGNQATAVSVDNQRTQQRRARNTMGRGGR